MIHFDQQVAEHLICKLLKSQQMPEELPSCRIFA